LTITHTLLVDLKGKHEVIVLALLVLVLKSPPMYPYFTLFSYN